jgi:hypothetical protein
MARAHNLTRWTALVFAASLVAGWAALSSPARRWASFADTPTGQGQAGSRRAPYPVAMKLPEVAFAGNSSVDERPLTQEARRDDTSEMTVERPAVPVAKVPRAISPGSSAASSAPGRFMVTDFGSSALDEGGQVRTTKPVFVAGNRVGTIELSVGRGASVSLDPRALAALVADTAPALTAALERAEGDRVALSALRNRAVSIRYDPVADALLIETQP